MQGAWQRAKASGQYHFAADVTESSIPLPKLGNIGRASKDQTFHIEGSTNLPQQHLELALWQDGGSVADPNTATSIKVDGDTAYLRKGGQAWEPIPDFTGVFAPSGDFLGYLSAAKNIVKQGQDQRAGIEYTRYTFDLDGMGFAGFVRDELQAQLQKKVSCPTASISISPNNTKT